jgi:hypothetical protein
VTKGEGEKEKGTYDPLVMVIPSLLEQAPSQVPYVSDVASKGGVPNWQLDGAENRIVETERGIPQGGFVEPTEKPYLLQAEKRLKATELQQHESL